MESRKSLELKIAASLGKERWEVGSITQTLQWLRKLKILLKKSSVALVYPSKCLAITPRLSLGIIKLLRNFLVITFMFHGIYFLISFFPLIMYLHSFCLSCCPTSFLYLLPFVCYVQLNGFIVSLYFLRLCYIQVVLSYIVLVLLVLG